ncbi:transcriptional regulator [Fusibacter sp. 3D3]|nr:transcriptional regulator [Fusibacter sp. 3D3]
MTVNVVAKMTGITIRTLHYYDQIELLSPTCVSSANYRFYSHEDIDRLQQILFFKEVGFNLKEIKIIMSAPLYSKEETLKRHVEILVLKRDRIDELIELIDKVLKGESKTNFSVFNEDNIIELQERYHQEVLERWENTTAYQQYKNKYAGMERKNEWLRLESTAQEIFGKIFHHIDETPDSKNVQAIIHEWRNFISANYYDCSIEMLRYLGFLYVSDKRFSSTINSYGDERLSEFVNQVITIYCDNNISK